MTFKIPKDYLVMEVPEKYKISDSEVEFLGDFKKYIEEYVRISIKQYGPVDIDKDQLSVYSAILLRMVDLAILLSSFDELRAKETT